MDLNELITLVNDAIWGYVLIFVLVACGVWFTFKTRFVQFRMVGEMFRLLTDSAVNTVEEQVKEQKKGETSKHISSFQAFAVSVATRVGTGNLAGVASAIAIGGPGSVFWMWLIALIGSATAFVESTLAQLYKQKHKDSFIGGPAYYIQKGLKQRWMAITFAILITCQFGLSNNSIQANTICGAMQEAFGWSPLWVLFSNTRSVHCLRWHSAHCPSQCRIGSRNGCRLSATGYRHHHHEHWLNTRCV